ncbi:MAG: N-acyl homoserine lactonase family protein [Thermoplasmatales archaeon]
MVSSRVSKLYFLDFGQIEADKGWFLPGGGTYSNKNPPREYITTPVTGAVIEYDDGYMLVDTGVSPEANKVWPKDTFESFPVTRFSDENKVENQLKKINLSPADITHVLFTHLHLDHVGQAYVFAQHKIPLVVHIKELEYALVQIWNGKMGAYVPADFDPLRGAEWRMIDTKGTYNLIPGIDLVFAGGHTPGSMMIQVETKKGNNYLITGDFLHEPGEYQQEAKGWLLGNSYEWFINLRKLKLTESANKAKVIISHDPEFWQKYPKPPKFFD